MFLATILVCFFGSALAGLAGRWLGYRGSGTVTVFGVAVSAIFSAILFHEVTLQGCPVSVSLGPWFSVSNVYVQWNLHCDTLTACIMLTVSTVSFCVHIYSLGYMQADPHLPRFMSYLSLFTGSMLLLVAANDLVTLLVGWELIGVSSYLLIGFWFHSLNATKAAQQAMLVNRISDTLLFIGLVSSWWYVGTTDTHVLTGTSTICHYNDVLCLLLLCGALGKSAQVGLHIWLPFAMMGFQHITTDLFNNSFSKSANKQTILCCTYRFFYTPQSPNFGLFPQKQPIPFYGYGSFCTDQGPTDQLAVHPVNNPRVVMGPQNKELIVLTERAVCCPQYEGLT